eukprot:GHVR01034755.1.p2 GENE.GHVR01034755.1~~GHVR01034755.1.p2  ORF type:complete len:112 (-),score=28.84 GHVR01034755.1:802-1137(-)
MPTPMSDEIDAGGRRVVVQDWANHAESVDDDQSVHSRTANVTTIGGRPNRMKPRIFNEPATGFGKPNWLRKKVCVCVCVRVPESETHTRYTQDTLTYRKQTHPDLHINTHI